MSNRLYIIMRNDLASLNPGKACAQAAHAANQFIYEFGHYNVVTEWQKEAVGFGTTIVLMANISEIENIAKKLQLSNFSNIVYDPTYPVKDGEVTHLINIPTCCYVFGCPEDLEEYIGYLPLMY